MSVAVEDRARVEELVAEYRRSRERTSALRDELEAMEETVTSERGAVSVTVGSAGALRDLRLSEQAYQQHRPAELAELIVRLSGTAADRVARRAEEAVSEVLPAGADPVALCGGRRQGDDEQASRSAPSTGATAGSAAGDDEQWDEEEPYEQCGWLRSWGPEERGGR
ncbi:YbaB/EbfC family nucleoid-associated protein [Actinopolyspora saharensis]|uniref:Conserved DNA-binding protein YbaB n=1 Tax=Actinopolyspora saharensis TaxID=995062 RepID=A0A1H1EDK9_9ACTN|nr:YbaB/EbfC family nucleoid-associated protein [Actinopolyspora saharensis]SDQ86618.1 Conserved DNA-binding protein YbaB [Actinopolyspora saharensis]